MIEVTYQGLGNSALYQPRYWSPTTEDLTRVRGYMPVNAAQFKGALGLTPEEVQAKQLRLNTISTVAVATMAGLAVLGTVAALVTTRRDRRRR